MTIQEISDIVKEEIIKTQKSLKIAVKEDKEEEQKRLNSRIIEYVGFLNYLYKEREKEE